MAESRSFKTGDPFSIFLLQHEFREGVCRMLIRIAGKRIQGLELADRMQPLGNALPRPGAPAFDATGNLRRPEQQGGKRPKKLILARFEQGNQTIETGNLARGRQAVCGNHRLEADQPRTRKRLLFETQQDFGQQAEFASDPLDIGNGLTDPLPDAGGKKALHHTRHDKRDRTDSRQSPGGQAHKRKKREDAGNNRQPPAG